MDKSKKKSLIYRIAALIILILIAVAMFIIGRGHTVYFDNKALEYGEKSVDEVPYKIDVLVNGEKVASLKAGLWARTSICSFLSLRKRTAKPQRYRLDFPYPIAWMELF